MMLHWLVAFAFTQLVEVPIYLRATRGNAVASFGASSLTHPIVWFVVPPLWHAAYLAMVIHDPRFAIGSPFARYACTVSLAETFAIGVEALYLRAFRVRRALAWSVAANTASVTLGLLLRAMIGWP